MVLAFQHLAGRGVGVAADLDAEAFGIAVVHLVLGELAALHAQHLDPLDLFPRPRAARLVVLLDAGMHATAAADAFPDVQGVAHEHARLRPGGIDGDLLAVLGRIAPFEPGTRLGFFLVRHQAVVLLEMLGPFGGGLGIVGHRHQRCGAHQRGNAEHSAAFEKIAARGGQARCGRICRRGLRRTFG